MENEKSIINETLININKRYSLRGFSDKPLATDILQAILQAGMTAPVGMRRYDTLHLTVVRNKAFFDQITQKTNMATAERPTAPLYNAPVLVFVSSKIDRDDHIEYANVGCVMENMAIAATSLGVDSIYLWGFLRTLRSDPSLLAFLNLPVGFTPLSVLALGYSASPSSPTDGTSPRHSITVDYLD